MPTHTRQTRRSSRQSDGFSIIEMTVGLFVMVEILVVTLLIFDSTGKLTRAQLEISDMQQSQRVAHHHALRIMRMAGRGGLPAHSAGRRVDQGGIGVAVRRVTASDEHIGQGADTATTPRVRQGSDVLTIRGVLSSTVYQINYPQGVMTLDDPGNPTSGTILISSSNPTVPDIPQNLDDLIDTINDNIPEALLMVSPLTDDIYAVVELNPATSDVSNPAEILVGFRITGGTHTAEYLALSPGGVFPGTLNSVAYVGILEEYRFYIRRETTLEGPQLARARVFPGSEVAHRNNAENWEIEIAENILDLQLAVGFDTDGDGLVTDNGDATDEWLYNDPNDNPAAAAWTAGRIFYLRMSTLTRTARRERGYQASIITTLEDRTYDASFNSAAERMYRRRFIETVIDLRNLG